MNTIAIIFLFCNQSLCPYMCFYILFICHVRLKKKDMVHLVKWTRVVN